MNEKIVHASPGLRVYQWSGEEIPAGILGVPMSHSPWNIDPLKRPYPVLRIGDTVWYVDILERHYRVRRTIVEAVINGSAARIRLSVEGGGIAVVLPQDVRPECRDPYETMVFQGFCLKKPEIHGVQAR